MSLLDSFCLCLFLTLYEDGRVDVGDLVIMNTYMDTDESLCNEDFKKKQEMKVIEKDSAMQ